MDLASPVVPNKAARPPEAQRLALQRRVVLDLGATRRAEQRPRVAHPRAVHVQHRVDRFPPVASGSPEVHGVDPPRPVVSVSLVVHQVDRSRLVVLALVVRRKVEPQPQPLHRQVESRQPVDLAPRRAE